MITSTSKVDIQDLKNKRQLKQVLGKDRSHEKASTQPPVPSASSLCNSVKKRDVSVHDSKGDAENIDDDDAGCNKDDEMKHDVVQRVDEGARCGREGRFMRSRFIWAAKFVTGIKEVLVQVFVSILFPETRFFGNAAL
ncbi:unnamed protein product [Vicia faba]|uniref:Uncharacterized protein n=1 Tax=Vicia faba TaxID=3906 RepID=A0AAV1B035_VICFA|nr:unnamed protein product [Vicia faba]